MNKRIDQILSLCNNKLIDDSHKSDIFRIIREELIKEHVSENELLNVQKIFKEKIFNDFYVEYYPEYFINTKENLIESLAKLPKSSIMNKLPLLNNYKDNLNFNDFSKILTLQTEDDDRQEFLKFCWNNLFKEDFILTLEFKESLNSKSAIYGYTWGEGSAILTPLILKNMDNEENIFSTPCYYEDKETLPFHDNFILGQIFGSIYHEQNLYKQNTIIIKEYYKSKPEEFNTFLIKLMLEQKNNLTSKKKYLKNLRSALIGDYKSTLINGLPYLHFEAFLKEDFKKELGENIYNDWLTNNNIEDILPFIIGNPKTEITKDILKNKKLDSNILKILINFADKNPGIKRHTYNQGINKFSGGGICRIIKSTGDLKGLQWDNIFTNAEHIKSILLDKTDEIEFNSNLIELRKHSQSLANEICVFCLSNDLFLNDTNITLTLIDYFKGCINSDLFNKVNLNFDTILIKHEEHIDYHLILEEEWNMNRAKERDIYVLAEKKQISQTISTSIGNENIVKRKRM